MTTEPLDPLDPADLDPAHPDPAGQDQHDPVDLGAETRQLEEGARGPFVRPLRSPTKDVGRGPERPPA